MPFMTGLRHPEDFVRPWDERCKVEIEVEESDTLKTILKRGTEALGSELPPADYDTFPFVDFFVEGRGSIRLRNELTLVDDEGRVRWTWKWADEPYSELLRAHEAGVLVGDPTRIYVLRQPGIGNGVLADFPSFVELLRLTFEVLGAVGAVSDVRKWVHELVLRGRKATDTFEKYRTDWETNGAMPHKVWEFLRQQPWTSGDLARALGANVDEVESILLYLGHVRGADGFWRPGDDALSQFLAGNAEFLLHNPHVERRWVRLYLQERLEEFVETGEAPELSWPELPTMPPSEWTDSYPPGFESTPQERAMDVLRSASKEAQYWLRRARSLWRQRRSRE